MKKAFSVVVVWVFRYHFYLLLLPRKKDRKRYRFFVVDCCSERENNNNKNTIKHTKHFTAHRHWRYKQNKTTVEKFFQKDFDDDGFFLVNMCNSGNTKHMVYEQERKRERDWAEYPESESILGRKILFEKSSFGEANSFSLVWAKLDLIFDMPHSFIHSHTSKTMIINNDYH